VIIFKETRKLTKISSVLVFENEKGSTIDIVVPNDIANVIDVNLRLLSTKNADVERNNDDPND
jgi:hypothetical protein